MLRHIFAQSTFANFRVRCGTRSPGTAIALLLHRRFVPKRGGGMLEVLVRPFFALIDAALDRPPAAVVAASMVGTIVAILLMVK
jgi:hypothetical protein